MGDIRNANSVNRRIGWIDTARGVAMFLIVLGHSFRLENAMEKWVYACHVPLFLLISGMCFSVRDSFGTFFKKRIVRLVVPYLCFALVSIAIYALVGDYAEETVSGMGGTASPWRNVLGMLWGNAKNSAMRWNRPLWYLPMIFSMEIVGYWFPRPQKRWQILAELILGVAAAWLAYDRLPRISLPWDLETVLFLCPMILVGRQIGAIRPRIEQICPAVRLTAALILLAVGTALVPLNERIQYSGDVYGNYGLFLLIALALGFGILLVCSLCADGVVPLNCVGRNTVGILVMHKFPIMFFAVLPFTRGMLKVYPAIASPIVAVLSIGMCLASIKVLQRIAPWSIGIGRRSN